MLLTLVEIHVVDVGKSEIYARVNRLTGEYRIPLSAIRGFRGRSNELKGRVCKGLVDLSHPDISYRIKLIEQFEITDRVASYR